MSMVTDIADAVAAELNGAESGTFSETFTAERRVLPEFDLEDLADLMVSVVPKAVEITGASRSVCQYEISIDIGIQKKIGTDLDAEVAALGTLVDEIADFLRRRTLDAMASVAWIAATNDPVYSPAHLAERRVFTSVLTVKYRAMK